MGETPVLALSGLAGALLGVLFFGGLWWTVRLGVMAKQPALIFLGSWVIRMSLVLAGFYFVGGHHWERLLICLLGFIAGRLIVTRLTRQLIEMRDAPLQEGGHATQSR